jgi:hypothetical protein
VCGGEAEKLLVAGRAQLCPEKLKNGYNLRIKSLIAACVKRRH